MACTLEATQTALCTSGIGKVNSRVQLLQVIAQTLCGASLTPVDPYDNRLVYIQQGGAETIIENPTGAYNLTALVPKVTEIHCHNAPNITSITCTSDALLTVVDLVDCVLLKTLVFTSCTGLTSLNLSTFTSLTTLNLQSCTSLASLNISNLATVTGDLNWLFSAIVNPSAPALISVGGNFQCGGASVTGTLSCPLLETVGGQVQNGSSDVTSVVFTSLQTVGTNLLFNNNSNLIAPSFPALTSVGNFVWFNDSPDLVSISIPLLTSYTEIAGANSPLLTTIAGPQVALNGAQYLFSECALTESAVDSILQKGIDAGMNSGTIYLDSGTNSPPSVAGAANAAQLLIDGVDVVTN
jgi:hypothetical protein